MKTAIPGIPQELTLEAARQWAQSRISQKRFNHVNGVAVVGAQLACDLNLSEEEKILVAFACYLHDCCKECKDHELVRLADELGLAPSPLERENGHLLHGPVGALTIKKVLGITNSEVLNSISEHTLGNFPMSNISKIVFLADCLEESRPEDFTRPIYQALGKTKEKMNLDKAMLVALNLSLEHVIGTNRPIHTKSVEVRNYFLGIVKGAKKSMAS
jgi:predicted HD superfamily hydrolase involved in NAD metabolism